MGEAHGQWQPMPASIYVYADDVEALYQRALGAGAISVEPPRDQPYGDRTAHVEDPHGNLWYLAQPIERPGTASTGLISADMKRVVEEQRLGFIATVCPDGTPNLSPKGTTAVWDGDHLVFANIRSPGTLANLRLNGSVEVNVVDPFVRKGYRFKGLASILESGPLYDRVIAFYRERGVTNAIDEVVMVRVQRAQPVNSPAYDLGVTEAEVFARWERHWQAIRAGRTPSPTGE